MKAETLADVLERLRKRLETACPNTEPCGTETGEPSISGEREPSHYVGALLPELKVNQPHIPTTVDLLPWASELAEQDLVLPERVSFVEAPKRTVTTERVSWYAVHYLKTISCARIQQQTGGWGLWTPEWWREREQEALGSLAALRKALEKHEQPEDDSRA